MDTNKRCLNGTRFSTTPIDLRGKLSLWLGIMGAREPKPALKFDQKKMTTVMQNTKGDQKMAGSKGIWKRAFTLALAGGLAFWATNFAISRTPIAAEYRAALSISYYPMLLESLIGGLIIGLCVSYCLLRFFDKIPGNGPILKSAFLSFIILILVTFLIGGPSAYFETNDIWRYFTIGTSFNIIRILALGIVVGYLYNEHISEVSK
jgi:hypothetical protein